MATPKYYDRMGESTTTTGTGTLTLGGALAGFRTLASVGNSNTTHYVIEDPATGDWEVGLGTYTSSGTTLARTTVLASSNAGAAVSLASGTKNVYGGVSAAELQHFEDTLRELTTQRLVGRNTAGTGDAEKTVTISQALDWAGTAARGDLATRGAATWSLLATGILGQYLHSAGSGADLAWKAPAHRV
jgi:hypothetical protein